MKEILIINGSGGVGKDTFVECLSKFAKVEHTSIAKLPKSIAKLIGWDGSKNEKDRKFLSDLKILIDEYNDKNYRLMSREMRKFIDGKIDAEILCIDMREKTQIDRARSEFGAKVVLVERTSVSPILSNPADANVKDAAYDYLITNNGTIADLEEKAKIFVDILKREEKIESYEHEKTIYISHPYGGKEENKKKIEELVLCLMELFPSYRFVSAVHAFGYQYNSISYERGLEECLWLLDKSDEMWIFGDYETSKGCLAEIEHCEKNNIPHGRMLQTSSGEVYLIPPSVPKLEHYFFGGFRDECN
jgi:dephospho-CoA kinase